MIEERLSQVVKGYELRETLGEGGYGVVYRAYQAQVGRDVAIKIILPQYANHPEFIRRFESEAQLVARLEHPYIVPLYDYWREPDGAYLVMRWLRGGSLLDALQRGPIATEQLGRLLDQIGGALAAAHRRHVIHRDLKPANILLDDDGNAYLADFGIAKDLGKKVSPYQTDQTSVVGSPAYISPEQVKADTITPQTDIYSLGVMLYEILTGTLPFQAPTPIALMFKHINEPVPRHSALSDAVNDVIQKATAKRPEDRYTDVATLISELKQALGMAPSSTTAWPPAGSGATPTPSSGTGAGGRISGGRRSTYETNIIYLPTFFEPVGDAAVYENPYKGLRAFQEADAADFFGRDALIEALLARLKENVPYQRFLAVVGPSGSGKSSVVRAGLVPALKHGALPGSDKWYVLEFFPGHQPMEELAQALLRIAVDPPNNLVEPLSLDAGGLLRVVDQVVPGGDETEVVLVIDQFEEVFTQVEDEAARTLFLDTLINAVTDPYSRVRVIATLRADFYDRPLLYPGLSALMRARTEVVIPLTEEELRAAIVQPAERAGLRVDGELVEAIVSDVGEQPGALPLLQYALTEVFERRNGRTLTLTPYQGSGGVLGALARRAEELFTGLDAEGQMVAQQLFLRLVTLGEGVEDTRRRVRRTELLPVGGNAAAIDKVIDTFVQYRLLTLDVDPQTRAPTVEVAHEALIRTWGRLRNWLDASREDVRQQRRLATAATEWAASGQEKSFLASGARLDQLEGWARETPLALNAEEQAYLAASIAARDERQAAETARAAREARLEARSKQFLRALVGVASVAAIAGILLSIFAFSQRSQAQANAQQAELNAQQAQANAQRADQKAQEAAAAQAEAQGLALTQGAQAAYNQGNIDLAGELALTAAQQPNPSSLAEQVLASVVYNPGARMVLAGYTDEKGAQRGFTDVINSVVYSPDETMAFAGGRNDQVGILWDLKTGKEIKRFIGHPGRLREVAFLPDGKRVLTAAEDGTVRLWDISCATPSPTDCNTPTRIFTDTAGFAAKNFEVKGIAVRPNHNQFITANSDFTLKLWDIDCATPSAQVCETPTRVFSGGHTQEANLVTFNSDGKYAFSTSEDTTLIQWDADTGQVVQKLQDPNKAELRGVAVIPGDRYIISGGAAGEIIKWDLTTGQVVDRLRGHKGTVYYVGVNRTGTQAISGGGDNKVIVWDLEKDIPLTVLSGHGGYIRQAVFSKDSKHALSGSADKTIRVWDLANGAEAVRLLAPTEVKDISVSSDASLIANGIDDGLLRVWNLKDDQPTGNPIDLRWHERAVSAVALSPDGKFLLSGGGKADGALIMTNLQTQQIEKIFKFKAFGFNSIVFTPDGKRVVTGQIIPGGDDYSDKRVTDPDLKNISMIVWDVASGEPLYKVTDVMVDKVRHDSINSLVITPDGKQIYASTGAGAKILVYDLETGKKTGELDLAKDGKSTQLAMTPDGKFLVAGTTGTKFIVWDLSTGKRTYTSPPQSAQVTAVAISADGRFVAMSVEGEVELWDLQLQQKVRSFLGHARGVNKLVFTPNDKRLISASADGTTRIWRVEQLSEIIAWAKANRAFPELTCEQQQLYNLPTTNCKDANAS